MKERGSKKPIIVVAACIVRGNTVLLTLRNNPERPLTHLKWEIPGGKIKVGESPQEALVREIWEELGVHLTVLRMLPHVQSNIFTNHYIIIAFECTISDSVTPQPADGSTQGIQWATYNDVFKLDTIPGTDKFVSSVLKYK